MTTTWRRHLFCPFLVLRPKSPLPRLFAAAAHLVPLAAPFSCCCCLARGFAPCGQHRSPLDPTPFCCICRDTYREYRPRDEPGVIGIADDFHHAAGRRYFHCAKNHCAACSKASKGLLMGARTFGVKGSFASRLTAAISRRPPGLIP